MLSINYKIYRIKLKYPFGISRSSNSWYDRLLLSISDGEYVGYGEAAPNIRYGEDISKLVRVLNDGILLPHNIDNQKNVWNYIKPQLKGLKSLEACFDMAIWDIWSKINNTCLIDLLRLNNKKKLQTSFTIALGDSLEISNKLEESRGYNILKVKLGSYKADKAIFKKIRNSTDRLIRVDANEGWDLETALEMSKWLADKNVEFIEQPFPANQIKNTYELKKKSTIPIIADENSISSKDIPKIHKAFDGINIKLMKCGSMEEAISMIKISRKYNLKIMLGCMVETSLGISAIANLVGEVDYADLDGNLLINNDPFKGVQVVRGYLELSKEHGIGFSFNKDMENILI